jgi:hypothetical protein
MAGTYWKENSLHTAAATAQRAVEVLDSAGETSAAAASLRDELHNIITLTGRRLPIGTVWYAVVFIAGLYWGLSVASGAPMNPILTLAAPPFACLAVAWATVGGMSSRTLGAAATLYANFLFSFGIGYAAAASGFVRLGGYR